MNTSDDLPDETHSSSTWTLAEALNHTQSLDCLVPYTYGDEVLLVYWWLEICLVFDRCEFENAMTIRVERQEEDAQYQVIEVVRRRCKELTFGQERANRALRQFKAQCGCIPMGLQ